MKKQTYLIATLVMILTVAGYSRVNAQTTSASQLIANIPFAFNVGDKVMPAGEYTVHCTNPASDMKVLKLQSKDGHSQVLVQTNSIIDLNNKGTKLVFNRYGERYYFVNAWLAGDKTGMKAIQSRGEKATAREMAGIRRATEAIALHRK